MSKYCVVYNCIVLSQDCADCEEKLCRHIVGRKARLVVGDIVETEDAFGGKETLMYVKSKSDGNKIVYSYQKDKFMVIDNTYLKLKKVLKTNNDSVKLKELKERLKNEQI